MAALTRHWSDQPPIHITINRIVSAFGGGSKGVPRSKQVDRRTKSMSDEEVALESDMLKALAGQFGNVRGGQ